ncbi:hypothetical protein ACH42_13110 [Endozoicomonas sp. (ex Bugula neritina AB1)]|nr:hypothetical protein ACH42_13110 [Endozoicomonas sp. (ex Bugula neritina AB1)]
MFLDISTTVLLVLAALISVLAAMLVLLRKSPIKIVCRDPLFTSEARSFLGQLDIAVRSHLNVFPSLPVSDILEARRFTKGALALKQVSKQRFDYVLCHRKEMEVLCVIKLLPYGKNSDNKELNALRNVCEAAGLTLLEYEMKPYRNVMELRKVVFSACGIDELEAQEHSVLVQNDHESERSKEQDSSLPPSSEQVQELSTTTEKSPECPKCSGEMKLTTIKKGVKVGQECWVCSSYPVCRGARLLTPEPA